MTDELTARVSAIVAKNQRVSVETISLQSTFSELNIDSLDGLQIVFALEEEFQVDIPDDAAKEFRSVGEVVKGLETLLAAKESAGSVSAA